MQSTAVASMPGGGPLIYRDVDANYDNELTLGVGLKQTIFDAGTIANYSQARKGQLIREQSFEAVKQNLLYTAKKLYAQTQLAHKVIGIMEASEHTSMEIYQSIERKYREGAATELDLLMAEVDWKSKIPQSAGARKNSEICMLALHNLAGIPLSEEIVLGEQDDYLAVIIETQGPESSAMTEKSRLDSIFASRPDYRALLLSREMADLQKTAALSSFSPTVSAGLSFAYGGMGNEGSLNGEYDYTAFQLNLGVTIPLFTGGYRLSRVKSAEIEQDKASLSITKKQNDIEIQLIEIQMRLNETMERIESAQLIETTAKRAAVLAQSAYTNGLTTQLSVTEAINKLDQASLGLQNALFE
jgi:outer membrane protein TolC